MRFVCILLLVLSLTACSEQPEETAPINQAEVAAEALGEIEPVEEAQPIEAVLPGVEVLVRDYTAELAGKRVGEWLASLSRHITVVSGY